MYIDILLKRLESSQIGCFVGGDYLGVLGYADDITILAPTASALRSMLGICETFGYEFGITYNATKTVCIHFKGKGVKSVTPDVSLNGIPLQWKPTVKHLGNYISHNLKEEEEIKAKRGTFIGAVNGLLSNFRSAGKDVISHIFNRQCSHFYGCETWNLTDKNLLIMYTAWRKACRRIWDLPCQARSVLLPPLMRSAHPEELVLRRFATMYNSILRGHNSMMLRVANLSVNSLTQGLLGRNVSYLSSKWLCGLRPLVNNCTDVACQETKARTEAIRDIQSCLTGTHELFNFESNELKDLLFLICTY
jgi:hypothetical protein